MAEKWTFETALDRLDQISSILGTGEASLDEAMDLYAEASKLIAVCNKKLTAAQTKLEKLMLPLEEGEGEA